MNHQYEILIQWSDEDQPSWPECPNFPREPAPRISRAQERPPAPTTRDCYSIS